MMKKYGMVYKIVQNIALAILLTLFLVLLNGFSVKEVTLQRVHHALIFSFQNIFWVFSCFVCSLQALSGTTQTERLKIMYGYTRRQVFVQMQMIKVCSTAGMCAVAFAVTAGLGDPIELWMLRWPTAILLFVQSLSELISALYLRFRKMSILIILVVSACIGFFTSYTATGIVKKGEINVWFVFEFLQKTPYLWGMVLLVLILCFFVLTWQFLKKAEISQ